MSTKISEAEIKWTKTELLTMLNQALDDCGKLRLELNALKGDGRKIDLEPLVQKVIQRASMNAESFRTYDVVKIIREFQEGFIT